MISLLKIGFIMVLTNFNKTFTNPPLFIIKSSLFVLSLMINEVFWQLFRKKTKFYEFSHKNKKL